MVFIEVNTNYGRGIAQWERVRPTNGKPYQYNTYKEAAEMLEKLYPEICMGKDRVRANGDNVYVYPTGKDFTKQYPGFPKGWECFLA